MAGVALTILTTETGSRLPNIDRLRSSIGVGAGTVQKALQDIQQNGWVALDSKPRQGTVLISRHSGDLWRIAGLPTLSVRLPLLNSWEFQGLATGLRSELDRLGIPSTFLYGHGSGQRVAALQNGLAHIAVMSLGAAERWAQKNDGITAHSVLPAGSYYASDSVLVMARASRHELGAHLRIGVDRLSIDHTLLTEAEFPGHHYVDVSYAHVPSALTRGIIDAAVWHRTALGLSLDDQGLIAWPLEQRESRMLSDGINSAAIVVKANDAATKSILREVSVARVLQLQRSVVAGDALPLY
jgi:YhfZ C-terminal domain/Helix-turn-helix domain